MKLAYAGPIGIGVFDTGVHWGPDFLESAYDDNLKYTCYSCLGIEPSPPVDAKCMDEVIKKSID